MLTNGREVSIKRVEKNTQHDSRKAGFSKIRRAFGRLPA